jgi:AraC-like DNA-binding protein
MAGHRTAKMEGFGCLSSMRFAELDTYLRTETEAERWHKENPGVISNFYGGLPFVMEEGKKIYIFDFTDYFLLDDLLVIKETRYTELYPHFHKYMELNYTYSGKCTYSINGETTELREGDILLLQKNVIHSALYKGENDIVINIAFKDELFSIDFLNSLSEKEPMYDFVVNSFFRMRRHDNYIVIRNRGNELLNAAVESIALHYFSARKLNYKTVIDGYFRILFHHLVNATNEQMSDGLKKENDDVIYYVLNYISTHFQNGRLEEIAGELGYNYNYLSNLIKEKTGKTFSGLKLEHQLNTAYKLITETDLPISEICLRCGITNQTYFYRKFSEYFHMLPTKLRSG